MWLGISLKQFINSEFFSFVYKLLMYLQQFLNTFRKMLDLWKTNSLPCLWKWKVSWICGCWWPSLLLSTRLNWKGEPRLWAEVKRIWTIFEKTIVSLVYSASRRSGLFRWYSTTSGWLQSRCTSSRLHPKVVLHLCLSVPSTYYVKH